MEPVLISIVIPFFNTPWPLLQQCIDSILAQTERISYEVILVNDCSTDKTPVECCAEYIRPHPQFSLHHNEKNSGVSHTRNAGAALCRGRFIWFVDADDSIEPQAFARLRQAAEDPAADTVFFDYYAVAEGQKTPMMRQLAPQDCVCMNEKLAERLILGCDFNSPWKALYSRALLQQNGLRFDENTRNGEDYLFNAAYLQRMQKGVYLQECLYNYFYYSQSATRRFSAVHVHDFGKLFRCRLALLKQWFPAPEQPQYAAFAEEHIRTLCIHIWQGLVAKAPKTVLDECLAADWVKVLLQLPVNGGLNTIARAALQNKNYTVLRLLYEARRLRDAVTGHRSL